MRPIILVAALAAALSSHARADIVIDLKTGVVTETFGNISSNPISSAGPYTSSDNYAKVSLARKASGCTTTPFEALVEVNLAPQNSAPATRVSVTVEYEGKPSGWTTHLGDDIENNGYGGGTTIKGVAEAHTIGETFYVYSTGLSAGVVEKIVESKMRLTEGALHFNISDQKLTFGQPNTVLDSTYLKQLFDLSGTASDKKIYLGFNRVIQHLASRVGCGAKRVIIAFEN